MTLDELIIKHGELQRTMPHLTMEQNVCMDSNMVKIQAKENLTKVLKGKEFLKDYT